MIFKLRFLVLSFLWLAIAVINPWNYFSNQVRNNKHVRFIQAFSSRSLALGSRVIEKQQVLISFTLSPFHCFLSPTSYPNFFLFLFLFKVYFLQCWLVTIVWVCSSCVSLAFLYVWVRMPIFLIVFFLKFVSISPLCWSRQWCCAKFKPNRTLLPL